MVFILIDNSHKFVEFNKFNGLFYQLFTINFMLQARISFSQIKKINVSNLILILNIKYLTGSFAHLFYNLF